MSMDTKRAKFLSGLMLGATVKDSCKSAGLGRRSAYDLRDRDPEFAQAWDDAIEDSIEILEAEVRSRALDREDKQSHNLLMFLLKKLRPEYRESYRSEQKLTVEHVQEFNFSNEDVDEAIGILQTHANLRKSVPEEDQSS